MTDEDERALREQLARLLQEHRDLDAAIEALMTSPGSDLIQVQRLKKRKLVLRDKIRRIEDLFEDLFRRVHRIHPLERCNGRLHRHFTGDIPILLTADSVRHDRDRALPEPSRFLLRLPKSEGVFISFPHPPGGGLRLEA